MLFKISKAWLSFNCLTLSSVSRNSSLSSSAWPHFSIKVIYNNLCHDWFLVQVYELCIDYRSVCLSLLLKGYWWVMNLCHNNLWCNGYVPNFESFWIRPSKWRFCYQKKAHNVTWSRGMNRISYLIVLKILVRKRSNSFVFITDE